MTEHIEDDYDDNDEEVVDEGGRHFHHFITVTLSGHSAFWQIFQMAEGLAHLRGCKVTNSLVKKKKHHGPLEIGTSHRTWITKS